MSEVKLVKKWMAADGSAHDTKQAAEANALRLQVLTIMERNIGDGSSESILNDLLDAGLLTFKVKRERKPRTPKVAAVEAKPVKAAKAAA